MDMQSNIQFLVKEFGLGGTIFILAYGFIVFALVLAFAGGLFRRLRHAFRCWRLDRELKAIHDEVYQEYHRPRRSGGNHAA